MIPVLWLYGPPGAGKTVVGLEIFYLLTQRDLNVGYVDVDQFGMCYAPPTPENWAPEPAGDPHRHRLKARALAEVVRNA